MNVNRNWSPLC